MRAAVIILAVIATVALLPATGFAAKKTNDGPRVIIDTDLSKWWDDASTIGIANVLHNQGDLRLLGIVSDVPNDVAVAALDAINTAYGNPKIPLGNQKIDLAAATEVLSGDGWPTPMAWVDGQPGIAARVGGTLCATVAAKHPMRIVYENLFGCEDPGDGNWDAPTLIYAIDGPTTVFTELGQGGAAAINGAGGLVWVIPSTRTDDVYVHAADQDALNARIDELLVAE